MKTNDKNNNKKKVWNQKYSQNRKFIQSIRLIEFFITKKIARQPKYYNRILYQSITKKRYEDK